MCYSATVSFTAAAILIPAGIQAHRIARALPRAWLFWSAVPFMFGLQQIAEGAVWLSLNAGKGPAALGFALAFHFFSHFLWVWGIPLASCLVEPGRMRRRLFCAITLFGFVTSTIVYGSLLLHPEWMHVHVKGHSIVYDFIMPVHTDIHLPVTPLMLYGLIILLPLMLSSHAAIRIFGVLVIMSMALSSYIHNAAFVSVWCFFAAAVSLYILHMLQGIAQTNRHAQAVLEG